MKFNSFLVSFLFLISCAGEGGASQGYNNKTTGKVDDKKCENLTNAAGFEYDSGLYQDCVNTFSRSLKLGCGQKYSEDIYQLMAGAYIELDKLDSAKIVINDGLNILPNDRGVLGVAATVAKKQYDSDNQLFFLMKKYNLEYSIQEIIDNTSSEDSEEDIIQLEQSLGIKVPKGKWSDIIDDKIISFSRSRASTFNQLSEYYKNKAQAENEDFYYSDQIDYLEEWLSVDPANADDIIKKLRIAFKNAGRDAIEIDKRRWEQNESDANTALIYINELIEISDYDKVIEVCLTVLDDDSENIKILEKLSSAYTEIYDQSEAVITYEKLIRLKPDEIKYQTKISEIYRETGNYEKAIDFANKIVRTKPSGNAFYNRAMVYIALVDNCRGEKLTMSDKAVYEMAWQDLNTASSKGHKKAKKQAKFYINNNLITQFEDWFKLSGKPNTYRPKGKCYSMIKKSIRKREF